MIYLTFCPICQKIQERKHYPFTWEKGNMRGLKNEPIYHAYCCAKPTPDNLAGPHLQMWHPGSNRGAQ